MIAPVPKPVFADYGRAWDWNIEPDAAKAEGLRPALDAGRGAFLDREGQAQVVMTDDGPMRETCQKPVCIERGMNPTLCQIVRDVSRLGGIGASAFARSGQASALPVPAFGCDLQGR